MTLGLICAMLGASIAVLIAVLLWDQSNPR
jgi:hypothetical protein